MAITVINSHSVDIDYLDPLRTPDAILNLAGNLISGLVAYANDRVRKQLGLLPEPIDVSDAPVLSLCDEVRGAIDAVNDGIMRMTVVKNGRLGQVGLDNDGTLVIVAGDNAAATGLRAHRLIRSDDGTRLQELRGTPYPDPFLEFSQAALFFPTTHAGDRVSSVGLETMDQRGPTGDRIGVVHVYDDHNLVDAVCQFELDVMDELPPRMRDPIELKGNFDQLPRLFGHEPVDTPTSLRAQCVYVLRRFLTGVHEIRTAQRRTQFCN